MTTRRDEDPAAGLPDSPEWTPDDGGGDAPQPLPPAPGATRAERRRAQEAAEAAAARPFADAFTESPSGTQWARPTLDTPPTGPGGLDTGWAGLGTDGYAADGDGWGSGADNAVAGAYGLRTGGADLETDARGPAGAPVPGDPAPGLVPPPRDGREPLRRTRRPAAGDRRPPKPAPDEMRRDGSAADHRAGEPAAGEPRPGVSMAGDLRPEEPVVRERPDRPVAGDLRPEEPAVGERRPDRPVAGDRRAGEAWRVESRAGEPMVGDPREVGPGGFDPGDTGTWRVRDVVPGADGGRRTTVILSYLLGLLAVDHVRSLTRWAFALPVVGLILLVVRPRWIGLAVIVLGVLLIVGRFVAVRTISRRTLPRRYRPVEDDLRAAVEAGKANLRGELRRVGMPSSALALTRSMVRLGSSDSRRTARSQLRDIEIDRVLPRAQLDRALRVLDGAPAPR